MKQTIKKQNVAKQGWMMRLATAVGEKMLAWFCQCEMGMSPYDSQLFLFHSGVGYEEAATYHYIAHAKHYEGNI